MSNIIGFSCIHTPFDLDDYPDFLNDTKKRFKCDRAVCLGDEMDFHRISFHDKEPQAMGAREEHREALKHLRPYKKLFPELSITISNHTSRPFRIAAQAGIPEDFIKGYSDFMEAPNKWRWNSEFYYDGVTYIHGEGYRNAEVAARTRMESVVMGHLHTKAGTSYIATPTRLVFGLSVGCGLDHKAYAFNYAKNVPAKSILGCGVVIDGRHAFFVPMYKPDKLVIKREGCKNGKRKLLETKRKK